MKRKKRRRVQRIPSVGLIVLLDNSEKTKNIYKTIKKVCGTKKVSFDDLANGTELESKMVFEIIHSKSRERRSSMPKLEHYDTILAIHTRGKTESLEVFVPPLNGMPKVELSEPRLR